MIDFIQQNMSKLYQNTYYSQDSNKKDLEHLKNSIDSSLDRITSTNKDNTGFASISTLYNRLGYGSDDTKGIGKDIEEIFGNKSLSEGLFMSSYSDNKFIKEADDEVDTICKYMPKLLDALDAKQDNVLSADRVSKDFINVKNLSTNENDNTFKERIKFLKKKYKLIEFTNELYEKTSKYGEAFLYMVPYKDALKQLLKSKASVNYTSFTSVGESVIKEAFESQTEKLVIDLGNRKIISESSETKIPDNLFSSPKSSFTSRKEKLGLNIELNDTGVLESAISEISMSQRVRRSNDKKTIPDEVNFQGLDSQEGFIDPNNKDLSENDKLKIPGCVLKIIPREKVIPIYIDHSLCLGYYIIENESSDFFPKGGAIDPLMSMRSGTFKLENEREKKDLLLKYIAGELSRKIDSKFINANQDLTPDIYAILKTNDLLNGKESSRIKITYIPPEHMTQWYWKKDPKTNRGISDLERALTPAKLYVSLYVSNLSGYLTRGFDKRVYYVKQNIETNISQTLLNTINQIKKSNFGAREMTNIKTILNMQGRYNDYVIPVGATNEPPVQFEVLPGQQIEVNTDFMQTLEEMAVSATGVPYEYVQSRQTVDYAVRLTMASGMFLKSTYKRQSQVEEFLNKMMTFLYNQEYEETDELEVTLPPPGYLSLMNTSTLLENSANYVQSIVETEAESDDGNYIKILTKNLKRQTLSTYINYDEIDEIKKTSMMEFNELKKKES